MRSEKYSFGGFGFLLASVCSICSLQAQDVTWIPKISAPPVIDAEIDQIWYAQDGYPFTVVQSGSVESEADLSAEWYGLYDDTSYYFLVDIHDQFLESEAGSDVWRNDVVEVYFNMDNVKPGGNGHSGDNRQYAFHYNKPTAQYGSNVSWNGVEWAQKETSDGWRIEVKIPFSTLTTLNAVTGFSFGFDIAINDNDGFSVYDSVTYWWNSLGAAEYGNIDGAGTVGLGDPFDGNYAPQISSVEAQVVDEGGSSNFGVTATDVNSGDTLSFSSGSLPTFASLQDHGNGTATVTLNPQGGDAGSYSFSVTVSDGSRSSSADVELVVRDPNASSALPQFEPISDLAVKQGNFRSLDIIVTDSDSASVSISATELPSFASLQDNGDMTATLTLSPAFSTLAQSYPVTLLAQDSELNVNTLSFSVEVQSSTKATVFYCDPENGDIQNDGSSESPWGSLQSVFEAGKLFEAGDVIYLRDGYHGEPVITGTNQDYVYIRPEGDAEPTFSKLNFFSASSYWHVSGLDISRSYAQSLSRTTLVGISGQHNVLSDCDIYTVPDISGWSLNDWLSYPSNGVEIGGSYCLLENCNIFNISFGVSMNGPFSAVRGNSIRNFSGDALRGIGDDLLFEYNYIADNYNIDDNHDDGFQSWSTGPSGIGTGVIYRVTLRGNVMINTTDSNRPFQGPLQGIGCFDGMFEDWVVESNVIAVKAFHGIAFYGAVNCRLVNNTVLDQVTSGNGDTWMGFFQHKLYAGAATQEEKDFYTTHDNLAKNNLVHRVQGATTAFGTFESNKIINFADFDDYFVDYPFDLHLKEGSPAIDAGDNTDAATYDADGHVRPVDGDDNGSAIVDFGGYEYGASSWRGFPLYPGMTAKVNDQFGWLYVEYDPWVYSYSLQHWIYLTEAWDGRGWVYIP